MNIRCGMRRHSKEAFMFCMALAIPNVYAASSVGTAKPATDKSGDLTSMMMLDSRREAYKMFDIISLVNKNDIHGVCELAKMTLESNSIILDPKSAVNLSEVDKKRNDALYEKIRIYLKNGKCGPEARPPRK